MKNFYKVLCVVTLSIFSLSMYAQKEVIKVVPDYKIGQVGAGTVGNLNDTIAYVAANQGCGNVIFELERDAFYYSINEIRPDQQDLHVRAEEGDGRRPIIMAAANPDDGNFNQIFYEFTGNMTLEGLHILGVTTEGSQLDQALRTNAENLRVIVNDCIIEKYRDRALRMNNTGTKAYFTNSILRNLGEPSGGGRVVRVNTYCDSLVLQNCTIYNNAGSPFQNARNGLNYLEVTNCTFMNVGFTASDGIDVGRAKVALIADNVFYNHCFRRNSTYHDPIFRANLQDQELPFTDAERDLQFLNNNWYVDEAVAQIYEDNYDQARDTLTREIEVIVGEDTTYQVIPYKYIVGDVWIMDESLDILYDGTPALVSLQDTGVVTVTNNFMEKLTFTNPPAYPELWLSAIIQSNWDEGIFDNMDITNDTMYWVTETVETPFDLGYNQNAVSATAGRDGGKIGADWELGDPTVGIRSTIADKNTVSVYPNPATSILNIENDFKALQIFDMTGKMVYQSGDNSTRVVNVGNLTKGLYIIAITDMNDQKLVAKFVKK